MSKQHAKNIFSRKSQQTQTVNLAKVRCSVKSAAKSWPYHHMQLVVSLTLDEEIIEKFVLAAPAFKHGEGVCRRK